MKLGDLKPVLWSSHGNIAQAIVYDQETNEDLEYGCSVDYAVKNYADREVRRIHAYNNFLVITV